MTRLKKFLEDKYKLHRFLTITWMVAAVPILLFLKDSVPFLVFVSVYANVAGHWAAMEAASTPVETICRMREKE